MPYSELIYFRFRLTPNQKILIFPQNAARFRSLSYFLYGSRVEIAENRLNFFSKNYTDTTVERYSGAGEAVTMYQYLKTSPPVSPAASPPLSPSGSVASMTLPTSTSKSQRMSATAKRQKFLGRLWKFKQMDFEYAFWQMWYLFSAPQKVYRNFQYRKNTKDQFARDDPAFLVLLSFWLIASSIGFAFVLGLHFFGFLKFMIWVIFVDCIGAGILVASILWYICNNYFIIGGRSSSRFDIDVEWGYSFDVHLNAFFPLLMILHFFQLPFLNHFIAIDWFIGRFVGNTLWLIAICYYIYITFLGYSALSFLKKTNFFLYPLTVAVFIYVLSLALGWNFSGMLCDFYIYRVW